MQCTGGDSGLLSVFCAKPDLGACEHQVGVDKIKMRGKLRVTLPLFDELPCVAGIQVSIPVNT